jgi:hypothetical protein
MQSTSTRTARAKTLRFLALVALLLLAVEFLFGMVVNLFGQIPTPLQGQHHQIQGACCKGWDGPWRSEDCT